MFRVIIIYYIINCLREIFIMSDTFFLPELYFGWSFDIAGATGHFGSSLLNYFMT